jgi:hypothetical protein
MRFVSCNPRTHMPFQKSRAEFLEPLNRPRSSKTTIGYVRSKCAASTVAGGRLHLTANVCRDRMNWQKR